MNFSRKQKTQENASIKGILAESIEKTCLNRFFEKKYKSNISLHNSVITKLVNEFSEDIVIKALNSVRKDLNVDIAKSLQAYLTKCCHTEAENIRIVEEAEREKLEKIEEKKHAEELKKQEIKNIKNSNEEVWESFEKMLDAEKAEVLERAEKYYLEKAELTAFNPVIRQIFERNKTG